MPSWRPYTGFLSISVNKTFCPLAGPSSSNPSLLLSSSFLRGPFAWGSSASAHLSPPLALSRVFPPWLGRRWWKERHRWCWKEEKKTSLLEKTILLERLSLIKYLRLVLSISTLPVLLAAVLRFRRLPKSHASPRKQQPSACLRSFPPALQARQTRVSPPFSRSSAPRDRAARQTAADFAFSPAGSGGRSAVIPVSRAGEAGKPRSQRP